MDGENLGAFSFCWRIPCVKHPDNIPSQQQPWSPFLEGKGAYLIATCTHGDTHITPVFSWIPTKLHSCQTYQHYRRPSSHVPWHHITLLHLPLLLLFGSTKLPVISSSLPSVSKEHAPPCSETEGGGDHTAFWGLGEAPARNINCTHACSCLLAGAVASFVLNKCTEEQRC